MGRDLKVLYFERPVCQKKIHNVVAGHKDYDWDYDYGWCYVDNDENAYDVEYDGDISSRNPDLGSHDYFRGTKDELHDIIESMLTDEEDFDYRNYEAIGNLAKLLAYCPDDYDYIVIECD